MMSLLLTVLMMGMAVVAADLIDLKAKDMAEMQNSIGYFHQIFDDFLFLRIPQNAFRAGMRDIVCGEHNYDYDFKYDWKPYNVEHGHHYDGVEDMFRSMIPYGNDMITYNSRVLGFPVFGGQIDSEADTSAMTVDELSELMAGTYGKFERDETAGVDRVTARYTFIMVQQYHIAPNWTYSRFDDATTTFERCIKCQDKRWYQVGYTHISRPIARLEEDSRFAATGPLSEPESTKQGSAAAHAYNGPMLDVKGGSKVEQELHRKYVTLELEFERSKRNQELIMYTLFGALFVFIAFMAAKICKSITNTKFVGYTPVQYSSDSSDAESGSHGV